VPGFFAFDPFPFSRRLAQENFRVKRFRSIALALPVAVASMMLTFLGCGPRLPSYKLVPVKGTVKLDGAPLADADVSFLYDGAGPQGYNGSRGKTDPNGKYELTNLNKPGAVEGKYKVVISKITDKNGKPVVENVEQGMDVGQMILSGDAIESIPPAYSDLTQTKLTADVTAAKSDGYDFELTK
jgi:hypothetical protein